MSRVPSLPDSFLSLDEDAVRWRILLAHVAYLTHKASLVGSQAPIAEAIYQRIKHPVPGDIVYEFGALLSVVHGFTRWTPEHVVGILLRVEQRPSYAPGEWEADGNTTPVPTEDFWDVQYGPTDDDIVTWRNCSFLAIPLDYDAIEASGSALLRAKLRA